MTYLNDEKPPCPCIADGVMIATHASPGQGTFRIAPEKAPASCFHAGDDAARRAVRRPDRRRGQVSRVDSFGHDLEC